MGAQRRGQSEGDFGGGERGGGWGGGGGCWRAAGCSAVLDVFVCVCGVDTDSKAAAEGLLAGCRWQK